MFLTYRINTTGKPSKLASPEGSMRQRLWAKLLMLGRDWLIKSHPVWLKQVLLQKLADIATKNNVS